MKLNAKEAEDLAKKFRFENRLSETEAINLKTLLRYLGVLTVYSPLSDKAYGLSLKSPQDDKFMLVNCNNPRGRQHFTIAHELYHLYYDKNPHPHFCSDEIKDDEEFNANLFASSLLMPESGILLMLNKENIKKNQITLAQVLRLEQYFSVSRYSLLLRLKKLGFINETRLREIQIIPVKSSALQYGYDLSLYEPANRNLVIGDYGEKARLLFEKEIISEGHYNELLNLIRNGENEDRS